MKSSLLSLAIYLISARAAFPSAPAAPPPVRLAILVQDSAALPMGDLLTVQLSRRNDIQLLERAEIARVYQEQQLVASGRDYFKLGQVLGAHGLLILEVLRQGTQQFVDFRFIAVKQGVVLANERFEWSLANSPEWPTAISRLLSPLIPKVSVLPADAVPLSVIGLRSAIQSQPGRDLERQLTLLLLERLSRQPEVFVLERRKIQALTAEKELKGMDDSAFWNGSFLLEGTIDRDGYSERTLTINARLAPPRGGPSQDMHLSCARTNLAEAVDQLARLVITALKLRPATAPWSPAEEAEQYRSDADWAFRWGLLEQARAASEAAWALGLHSEPLARLRIRAYAQDVWPLDLGIGNIEVPGLPNPQKLGQLNRALELFVQDWKLEPPDGGRLNDQWYLMGSRLFRASAAMLDGFYRWVDLRDDNQLAETRRLTRHLLSLLESKAPAAPQTMRKLSAQGLEISREFTQSEAVKWNEGGLLYERPHDCLPFYASMLAQGYVPDSPPRIIGWTGEDRKSVPRLREQFIAESRSSTNPPAHLGGLLMALAQTEFYPQSVFQERESALANAIWECRSWIFADPDHSALLKVAEDLLRKKYSDAKALSEREPFAGVWLRLENEHLNTATSHQNKQAPADSASAKPARPAEETLLANFIRWDLQSASGDPTLHLHFDRPCVRNGRLWSLGVFIPENQIAAVAPLFCVSTDPATGQCQGFPFPQSLSNAENSFDVSPEAIYVGAQDHLARYRFASRTWDQLPVPIEGCGQILALGSRVFLANSSTLLELDPRTRATKILASARRRPPVNVVDTMFDTDLHLYAGSDGQLGVIASNQFLAYAPDSEAWSEVTRITEPFTFKFPFVTPDGVVLRLNDAASAKRRLVGFWNNSPGMDLLLEQSYMPMLHAPAAKTTRTARWDWPAGFDLGASRIAVKTNALWILAPRKIYPGFSPQEPVKFSDARQATLFCFESGLRAPLSVPVALEPIGIDPFDALKGGYFVASQLGRHYDIPFWIDTPAGLVLSTPKLQGHWLIPWAALEQRLALLRAKRETPGSPAAAPNHGSAETSVNTAK